MVDDEGRERLALDVLGDNQQRPPSLHDLVEQRQHVLQRGNLSIADQDQHVLMNRLGLFKFGDEIRRDEPPVELHAFDDFERRLGRLGFFDRNYPLVADLVHRFGDELSNPVVMRGNRADLGLLLGS